MALIDNILNGIGKSKGRYVKTQYFIDGVPAGHTEVIAFCRRNGFHLAPGSRKSYLEVIAAEADKGNPKAMDLLNRITVIPAHREYD